MYEEYARKSPRRKESDEDITRDILILDEILRFNYYNKKKIRDRKSKIVDNKRNRISQIK